MKKTIKAARPKKYKTADGDYLVLIEGDEWRILWFIAEWQDVGGTVGENGPAKPNPPAEKYDWEVWQAERTVAPFAQGRDGNGYYFESGKKAKLALDAANDALFTGDAPWPAWAREAKAAGWTPPKGWKP